MLKSYSDNPQRIRFLQLILLIICFIIIFKLFYLQIIKHEYYYAIAQKEHFGYIELPARRGNIVIENKETGENFKLATNTTFYTIYADPTLLKNKEKVASSLAPLLFNLEEEKQYDEIRVKKDLQTAKTEEERQKIKYLSEEELKIDFEKRLKEKISLEIREQILLYEHLNDKVVNIIEKAQLPGIFIQKNNLYAKPGEMNADSRTEIAQFLSEFIDITKEDLERILVGKNRYVILQTKVEPEITEQIQNFIQEDYKNFRGIGIQEKYYRLYPEKQLASQILGFVDHQSVGQYGIEGAFNSKLQGKNGIFSSQTDVHGNQLTVGDSIIRPAVDGDDIYLTIDRAVQLAVERKLERTVTENRADNGQVIILDPKTFRIIAMAYYPTFNPNDYGEALSKKEINLTEEEINRLIPLEETKDPKHFVLYIDRDKHEKIEIFKEEDEQGKKVYKMYKNKVGAFVFKNRAVSDIYEPGSVFKVITMASALNDNDVKPETTIFESGPIQVDCHTDKLTGKEVCDFPIRNSQDKYRGRLNMTEVLMYSSNIGISEITQKMGRNLLYSYIKNFGFEEKTDIEFDDENRGQIEYFEKWSQSELITHGFGQGIAVTPIQLISALGALANGGTLMQPHIIDKIVKENGEIIYTEPKVIRQVIKKETSDILTYMMVPVVEKGVAPKAKIATHYIAGKSGTSQTYKNGKAMSGVGTTVASFAGFGPIDDPKFVILVIIDRPRTDEWGSNTAAPLFSEIGSFLYDYYNIPPDKK
ncbi:hypothetical protein A2229_00315 [Candidatus Peregrinibacteria bacterium RIFOXYA2_FULL_33_7]|nr:MAG: transpeptidase involved in septal peptidoglycan synthesis (penicillin-binding protein 3), stage V sporulation protein D (sporulation-specific penicillin-binding protein) [Candidatus Peregrinibacteria bacterium GW2011_GWC2_33_13]OGJ50156.1 MAG: hypothetical protein A2229_00315 [Candidatus Peregrinibacteria bacterium RIFOXYA2_FULL_33_7]